MQTQTQLILIKEKKEKEKGEVSSPMVKECTYMYNFGKKKKKWFEGNPTKSKTHSSFHMKPQSQNPLEPLI